MPAWNETLVGSILAAKDKKEEQQRSEANRAKALRTYLSEIDPENRNRFSTMSLGELEGMGEAYAVKSAQKKQAAADLKAQREQQSAGALARILQDAGTLNESEVLAQGNGPVRQTRQPTPITASRLANVIARNPEAVASDNFAPTINAMRQLLSDGNAAEQGGLEFVKSPTGAVITREKKTGAFQYDPFSKADAEQNRTRFSVEPIMDRFGRPAGYGVKATFGSEEEAKAWAERQNGGTKTGTTASEYKTADEVKAAVKAGKLERGAAVEILRKQFGYQ